MPRPVVIVMVKAPRPGFAKTRLVPELPEAQAAALAACFAEDVVRGAARVTADLLIAYSPAEGRALLKAFLPGGLRWVEQQGADLGARLQSAATHAARLDFAPLIFIGADSPTLPTVLIADAITRLESGETDVVLGPTEDGGYYLIGLRRPEQGLFEGITWSTSRTLEQTAEAAARLGLRLLQLPPWYDVDTPSDLSRLCRELSADDGARLRAPVTCRWLLAQGLLSTPSSPPDSE
jgi:uncharacterized protein